MPEYKYGMRLRGFSPGCQPKAGLLRREDCHNNDYYDILVYNRKLNEEEILNYELDEIHDYDFQNRFRALRKQLGLSQVMFAKHYGISRRNVENWEMGIAAPPEWSGKLLLAEMERQIKNNDTGAE